MENSSDNSIAIEIHDMTVSYFKKPVLWNVDLTVPPGKLVGIIGPNGAGKSTMIKAALELITKASGWVKFFGKSYDEMRRKIGYFPSAVPLIGIFP